MFMNEVLEYTELPRINYLLDGNININTSEIHRNDKIAAYMMLLVVTWYCLLLPSLTKSQRHSA